MAQCQDEVSLQNAGGSDEGDNEANDSRAAGPPASFALLIGSLRRRLIGCLGARARVMRTRPCLSGGLIMVLMEDTGPHGWGGLAAGWGGSRNRGRGRLRGRFNRRSSARRGCRCSGGSGSGRSRGGRWLLSRGRSLRGSCWLFRSRGRSLASRRALLSLNADLFLFLVVFLLAVVFFVITAAGVTASRREGDNVCGLALLNSHNAEVGATSTGASEQRINQTVALCRINLARQAVATTIGALDLHTEGRKRSRKLGLFKNGVPAELDESLTLLVRVGTSNKGAPVANGSRVVTPDAALLASSRGVDVEVGSSRTPVARVGNSQGGRGRDKSRDKHSFVAR